MYRIGILGAENSHAEAFTRLFNRPDEQGAMRYPDCRVVAVGGHDPEQNERLYKAFDLEFPAEGPADMMGRVDAVMVTARDGKYHLEFALPFVEAGIPTFVDKPFTVSEEEALRIARAALKSGTPICGGSSVKYAYDVRMLRHTVRSCPEEVRGGSVAAPLNMVNPYGGFYFYSSHLAEISLSLFGIPASVAAFQSGNNVTAVARYDGYCVSNHFIDDLNAYYAAVYCKGRVCERNIDISLCYRHECDEFAAMLRSGKSNQSMEELIAPVFYLNAVARSYQSGTEQAVALPEL